MRAVEAYQRMIVEMQVEGLTIPLRQRLAGAADDRARLPLQITEAERRKVGTEEQRQVVERMAHERSRIPILRRDRVEGLKRTPQVPPRRAE